MYQNHLFSVVLEKFHLCYVTKCRNTYNGQSRQNRMKQQKKLNILQEYQELLVLLMGPTFNCQAFQMETGYINRKGFPSLQLQIVVSHKMLIIDADVGWPGSVHDARVYKNSPLFDGLQSGMLAPGHFLIGDGAYPLSEVMITPFRQTGNLSAQQKYFNKKVSSVRQTVERTIGHLKQRFRRLKDLSCCDMKSACEIIMCGCILHNMCVLNEGDLSEYLDSYDRNQVVNNYPSVYLDTAGGVQKRNEIVQLLHANR